MASEKVFDRLVTLFAESDNRTGYLAGRSLGTEVNGTGRIRVELLTECVYAVLQKDVGAPRLRLRKLKGFDEAHFFFTRLKTNQYIILARHLPGLCVSRRPFDTREAAIEALDRREGDWMVLCWADWIKMHPLPEQTDPFTRDIPLPESYVIWPVKALLSGPFVHPGIAPSYKVVPVYEWIMYFCPSGYYGTRVFERYAMNENVPATRKKSVQHNWGDEREGDYLVFEKYADGSFQQVWATPDAAAAEKWVKDSPGCLLAARWLYTHPML